MANKTHRYVKMFRTDGDIDLSPVNLAGITVVTIAITSVTLMSGGLRSASAMLMLVLPLWLLGIRRRTDARHAALASLTGAGLLAFIELSGLAPPIVGEVNELSIWVGGGLLSIMGIGFLQKDASLENSSKPPQIEAIDQPLSPDSATFDLPAGAGLLLVTVSNMGLVKQIMGARDWFPGLRSGRAAESCLIDAAGDRLNDGRVQLQGGVRVDMRSIPLSNGMLHIFMKTDLGLTESETLAGLRAKLEQRTQFFAGLGHDLRSPLNSVLGFADIMQSEIRGPLPEAYKEYPSLIRESGDMLLRLIDDMLAYARSESGSFRIHKVPIDLCSTTQDVLKSFAPIAARAGVTLIAEGDGAVWINADPQAIRRIWDNLVSNAIKYSDTGGKVVLQTCQRGKIAVLSVTDEGSGMDEEDLANIAEPFEQGRNAQGRVGTGLGLAMVKKFSEMHGGQTTIRTAPGEGTEVTVTFPLNVSGPSAMPQ